VKRGAAAEVSLLLAVVFLGSNPVSVKFAVAEVPPLTLAALRFFVAGILLVALLRLVEPGGFPARRYLPRLVVLGVVGVGVNQAAFALGVDITTASHTAMVYATAPIWGMLLGAVLGLERPRLRGVLGVALALAGLGLVVAGSSGESSGGASVAGDVFIMVAAACWGTYAVLSLPLLRGGDDGDEAGGLSPLAVGAYSVLFGGVALLPLGLPGAFGTDWGAVSGGVWAAVAYSTLCVSAYGFAAWQGGISRVGANRVLVYQYLMTLVGVSAGVLLLGEGIGASVLLGAAVLLCGVYLARR
jgi:drug/metabolite transporter (DMT)-like permease